jgi:Undecaprenyl-phosphate glucose phosphotransferase
VIVEPIIARSIVDAVPIRGSGHKIGRSQSLSSVALAVAERKVVSAYSPSVIAGLLRVIDFALISIGGLALYFGYSFRAEESGWLYFLFTFGIATTTVVFFQIVSIYQVYDLQKRFLQITRLVACWCLAFILFAGASYVGKLHSTSWQIWFAAFFCVGMASLVAKRLALLTLVRKWAKEGRLDRRTIIVGADENGERLITALRAQEHCSFDVLGVFDDRNDGRSQEICAGVPNLGKVDDILEFARRTRIDLVLFALPISAEKRILQMLKKLWVLPIDIHLAAHAHDLQFRPPSYSYLGKLATLHMSERPLTDWDMVIKCGFDRAAGALILLLAAPVMAFIALAIKLDSPGPVLFRQKRYGFNNEQIDVLKFRSLYHHLADPLASKVVGKNDPRVTHVGRFIRKTSLDELPQLFNVVFEGNLSLVGPRPHAVQSKLEDRLFDDTVDGYFARHRVKPGITGWAQINGWRGEIDREEKIRKRVEFDFYYIENWSVLFDLYILCRTPLALLKSENAY